MNSFGKTFLVSDIDDTLKKSNVGQKLKAIPRLYFGKSFEDGRKFIQDIVDKNDETHVAYVSSSYPFLYNAKKWLEKNNFPEGSVYQRSLRSGASKPYKISTIVNFLKEKDFHPSDKLILIGDSQEYDREVYEEVVEILGAKNAVIRIRNISADTQGTGVEMSFCPSDSKLCMNFCSLDANSGCANIPRYWFNRVKNQIQEVFCSDPRLSKPLANACLNCLKELTISAIKDPNVDLMTQLSSLNKSDLCLVSEAKKKRPFHKIRNHIRKRMPQP